ncbi:MAG: type II toxin-antitoxin system Phd/YefM family antitoxin [Hyphomicrobiaceae bacterium]|nr:MAG: type II toxin-antitoxin system Phd/YefM family antitoxin [Hyphomicrobiaceae bacterium]
MGHVRISAAEFVRQFGRRCDEALAQPVIITRNGRDRLIVMSLAMYRELTNPTNPAKPHSHKQAGNGRSRPRKR